MSKVSRPAEAALPPPQRPQVPQMGGRPRPSHLLRTARLEDCQRPTGLTNPPSSVAARSNGRLRGHSYRNAAFQALLNTPMFVNFLRAHNRRVESEDGKCTVVKNLGSPCLMCHMYRFAGHYWLPSGEGITKTLTNELDQLWRACLHNFWGQHSFSNRNVGPSDDADEFYTESFLLHLLAEMKRELEVVPGEHQTFLQMFTVRTVRRWKCSQNACDWVSVPHKWEESLYLPIDVSRPIPHRSTQTTIMHGIRRALDRQAKSISPRRGSVNTNPRCGRCSNVCKPHVDIVDFPEILILVRNTEELEKDEHPDVPYEEALHFKSACSDRSLQFSGTNVLAGSDRDYTLVAGTAELLLNPTRSQSVAFSRGPSEAQVEWYAMADGVVEELSSLAQLDRLQRAWDGTGACIEKHVLPEVFIYRRTDDVGWNQQYGLNKPGDIGFISPPLDEAQRLRDLVGRSVTDIFTQKLGQGLLKLKVKLAPADPGPHDSIPFSLELGYEFKNNHWRTETKITDRLLPAHELSAPEVPLTIPESEPFYRYKRRAQGPATPIRAIDEDQQIDLWLEPGNIFANNPSNFQFDNPFATSTTIVEDDDAMELDEDKVSLLFRRPDIERVHKNMDLQWQQNLLRNHIHDPWAPQRNNKEGKNKHKNNRGNKNNNNNNRDNNYNGNGSHNSKNNHRNSSDKGHSNFKHSCGNQNNGRGGNRGGRGGNRGNHKGFSN